MHPILITFGPLTLYTYGLFIALGFLCGISLAVVLARREGLDPQQITDLSFYLILAAIIGSRLLYVLLNYQYYSTNPWAILQIWEGGLVFYGGLIGAASTGFIYIKSKGLNIWQVGDIFAPVIALGQAIGRWGCFFAGCCYGKPTSLPWAITFHDPASLAPIDIPLHPTQLYSSLKDLTIFALLMFMRPKKRFHGQLFWSYVLLYSTFRFLVEFFRGDPRGTVLGGLLSTPQALGIPLFILAIIMLWRLKGKAQGNPS
jgi:phosphatidylglycerol:prolipoprotein diacylglycerol transferase